MTTKIDRRHFVGVGSCLPFFGLRGPKNRARGKKEHAGDRRLYHGPLRIDRDVIETVYENPVVKTTHRKLCVKVSAGGIDYVFRVVGSTDYLGEIVQTDGGQIRIHVWKILRDVNARSVASLVAWHRDGVEID